MILTGLMALSYSCGVAGDPGHCYFSLDWEYYNEDYGVYLYRDDNPEILGLDLIERGAYYDCYPGHYEYYYESEDTVNWYTYTGYYTLYQNPGSGWGIFHDGVDGADTYFDLYLFVVAREDLAVDKIQDPEVLKEKARTSMGKETPSGRMIEFPPIYIANRTWKQEKGAFTLTFTEEIRSYRK